MSGPQRRRQRRCTLIGLAWELPASFEIRQPYSVVAKQGGERGSLRGLMWRSRVNKRCELGLRGLGGGGGALSPREIGKKLYGALAGVNVVSMLHVAGLFDQTQGVIVVAGGTRQRGCRRRDQAGICGRTDIGNIVTRVEARIPT